MVGTDRSRLPRGQGLVQRRESSGLTMRGFRSRDPFARVHRSGLAMCANEIRMIPLEATTTDPVCNHT